MPVISSLCRCLFSMLWWLIPPGGLSSVRLTAALAHAGRRHFTTCLPSPSSSSYHSSSWSHATPGYCLRSPRKWLKTAVSWKKKKKKEDRLLNPIVELLDQFACDITPVKLTPCFCCDLCHIQCCPTKCSCAGQKTTSPRHACAHWRWLWSSSCHSWCVGHPTTCWAYGTGSVPLAWRKQCPSPSRTSFLSLAY